MSNPRRANGTKRDAIARRWRNIGAPCAICGRPIDYTLPPYQPGSFEVDEIVPVRAGGDPLDFSNTQPVHRQCNQWKYREEERALKNAKRAAESSRPPVLTSRRW